MQPSDGRLGASARASFDALLCEAQLERQVILYTTVPERP